MGTNVKLPSYNSAKQLAGKFSTFFMRKITAIRDDLICASTGDLCSIAMKADNIFSGGKLEVFHPASDSEIKGLIFNSPNKSCDLDPLPTWLLKKCIDPLQQPITAIINRSLGMDEEDMSSYQSQPISKSFLFVKMYRKLCSKKDRTSHTNKLSL